MYFIFFACRWVKLNGPDGCPAEDDNELVLRVKVFSRQDILRQRKNGIVTERKWLKTEEGMTARAFMAQMKETYEVQVKREFMGNWQAYADRSMEDWCMLHTDGYCVKFDWLQNPEMNTHRELQSDHWYNTFCFTHHLYYQHHYLCMTSSLTSITNTDCTSLTTLIYIPTIVLPTVAFVVSYPPHHLITQCTIALQSFHVLSALPICAPPSSTIPSLSTPCSLVLFHRFCYYLHYRHIYFDYVIIFITPCTTMILMILMHVYAGPRGP